MSVRDNVREVLKNSDLARNSDNILLASYYKRIMNGNIEDTVADFITNMPSFESITRARRSIQNKEGLYKSNDQIDAQRRKAEQDMKEQYARD